MSESILDQRRRLASRTAAFERMERLRDERTQAIALSDIFEALEEAFLSARSLAGPSTSSGLVIQQAWFMKGRK